MVEVFKTNVTRVDDAEMLIELIHQCFKAYKANFDLDDCDLILRIQHLYGAVLAAPIILLLNQHGFNAEVLEDDFQPFEFHSLIFP